MYPNPPKTIDIEYLNAPRDIWIYSHISIHIHAPRPCPPPSPPLPPPIPAPRPRSRKLSVLFLFPNSFAVRFLQCIKNLCRIYVSNKKHAPVCSPQRYMSKDFKWVTWIQCFENRRTWTFSFDKALKALSNSSVLPSGCLFFHSWAKIFLQKMRRDLKRREVHT